LALPGIWRHWLPQLAPLASSAFTNVRMLELSYQLPATVSGEHDLEGVPVTHGRHGDHPPKGGRARSGLPTTARAWTCASPYIEPRPARRLRVPRSGIPLL
jgi:hypothetical protein